ncbi:MAG: toll/interleukin-1 receptor domain-containing protein [Ignavibacteria bacterium]|nr:toll/interleukin-1 receptor domain-containing protein [Ignavibacteria bacterium]
MTYTKMSRDIVFIGHANPEDDEFTLWLHAKLKNEGYRVECDLTCLTGGEDDYWKVLQDILDNRASKYLLVLSKHTFDKRGVIDEWEQAKAVAQRTGIQDFIMILKIDDVPFDIRISVNVKNHFRFDLSWAKALKKLLIKLDRDIVPRERNNPLSIDDWFKNRYTTLSGVCSKVEKFYSNWLPIELLPNEFYAYRYFNDSQAAAMLAEVKGYPVIRHDNYLLTFLSQLPTFNTENQFEIRYLEKLAIPTQSVFERDGSEKFPVYADRRRFIVRLLNDALQKYLSKRGLQIHEMSQKQKCFYYELDPVRGNKIHFEYEQKPTWKQLVGDYFESKWHYGISFHTLLYPHLCYSLRAHIVFSDDGKTIWESKTKLHRARRSKGKMLFNEQWRMLMLAFVSSLAHSSGEIIVPLTEELTLRLPASTMMFESRMGYEEPKESGRLVPLDYYEETGEQVNEEDPIEEDDEAD